MKVFIIGEGRSGTHWVAHLLAEHPEFRVTIEEPHIFRIATRAAMDVRSRPVLLPVLRAQWALEGRRSTPLHYADKSHPALWYADRVARWFTDARFVAIERGPFGAVASMLRHNRVSAWDSQWARWGPRNPYAGLKESEAPLYSTMSPTEKAARRWRANHDQMERMRHQLGERLLFLRYEELIDQFDEQSGRIWEFLGVEAPAMSSVPDVKARDKWRDQLDEVDVATITAIVGQSDG